MRLLTFCEESLKHSGNTKPADLSENHFVSADQAEQRRWLLLLAVLIESLFSIRSAKPRSNVV
jgi:hypothetical protein